MADALEVVAARLRLGKLPAEELPGIAVEAILAGHETMSLYQLAGLTHGDLSDARDLAQAALDELGVARPSRNDALWTLVRAAAQQAVDGVLPPIDAARWIARNAAFEVEEEGDLRVFRGLASTWDDGYVEREYVERDIVAAAAELLARPHPRRWIQLRAVQGEPPLRRYEAHKYVAVDPDSVGLSSNLVAALSRWAATFAARAEGWDSEEDLEPFVADGVDLRRRLQDELGDGWQVEYWPEPTRPLGAKLRRRSDALGARVAKRLRGR